MSIHAAKRARREAGERELLRTGGGSVENGPGPLRHTMLRRAAIWLVAGAVVLGGADITRRNVAPTTGTAPKYEVEMVFVNHGSDEDAIRLMQDIDQSNRDGKPIRMLLMEDMGQRESEYESYVRNVEGKLAALRRIYSSLVREGVSEDEAERICRGKVTPMGINVKGSGFTQVIMAGAARRGLKILPIEAYPEKDSERLIHDAIHSNQMHEEFVRLCRNNATLGEMMEFQRRYWQQSLEGFKCRDKSIVRNLKKRLRQGVELFPDLREELAGGRELRVVGFIGTIHASLYARLDRNDPEVVFREKVYLSMSKGYLFSRIAAEMGTLRPFTRREGYLAAIDERVLGPVIAGVGKSRPEEVKRLAERALGMTEMQLEALDAESSRIGDSGERWVFILNRIQGRKTD